MQAEMGNPPNGISHESVLRLWQAGFIEDAEDLHLARKPMFAALIRSMLVKRQIRADFIAHAPGGAERLDKLERIVAKELECFIRDQGLEVTDQTMPAAAPTAPAATPQPVVEIP